ncbi:MAG: YheC/YheD family protein [Alicyclobacillus herbarius]|uniref:YheC/YheD family endospore coat-associated protein n=1 Tax=Alicyclobacillus herbarius TaxID=122960 RepID=UPI002356379C|nr:YheC/YheD family protein [Alicyclobacillus herbarius]MCL6632973.1 YheC/YheD family protein [Alicyclobacillus herbarius]
MRRALQLVWLEKGGKLEMAVVWPENGRNRPDTSTAVPAQVRVSNLLLPCYESVENARTVFRTPLDWRRAPDGVARVGPVFAILAGGRDGKFVGNRSHFRDLIRMGRRQGQFVYVLPDDQVNDNEVWTGFVRIRPGVWRPLPCPRPQAVYNRIPLRHLEKTEMAANARRTLKEYGIPMFNPEYFDKAVLYRVLSGSALSRHLPESAFSIDAMTLDRMLQRYQAVYLKPAGGSMGHGIMRIERQGEGYRLQVLKKGRTRTTVASDLGEVLRIMERERTGGAYVMQAAKELLKWEGHPCDFRVLLQKHRGMWRVVGVGVRVAGDGVITTHVPNGGSIAAADLVLRHHFGPRGGEVKRSLEHMAVACARAIDRHYREQLGEMSMDIGIDQEARLWFFEANSKPMKFDEPEIWRRGLRGTLIHLAELADLEPVHARV